MRVRVRFEDGQHWEGSITECRHNGQEGDGSAWVLDIAYDDGDEEQGAAYPGDGSIAVLAGEVEGGRAGGSAAVAVMALVPPVSPQIVGSSQSDQSQNINIAREKYSAPNSADITNSWMVCVCVCVCVCVYVYVYVCVYVYVSVYVYA